MNKRFPVGWVIATLALIAYFSLGLLLTGEVAQFVGVLLLVLVIWFLFCRIRYKDLGNLELVMKMYADLKGAVERIKERVAEDEAPRRAASRRRHTFVNRESRKADRPQETPTTDKKYADMIERRVREARARQGRRH